MSVSDNHEEKQVNVATSTENNQSFGIASVYFLQAGTGPIMISISRQPNGERLRLQSFNAEELHLLGHFEGWLPQLQAIHAYLAPHRVRGSWFVPSPEVLAVVKNGGLGIPPAPRTGGRRLTKAQVLEIFRLTHGSSQAHAVIGEMYGISRIAVGKISRGQVYPALFTRTMATDVPRVGAAPPSPLVVAAVAAGLDYYISEAGNALAPRYRMTSGRRGSK